MSGNIAIIQGHPDPAGDHLCHALGAAYEQGARGAGYRTDTVDIAQLDFPWIPNKHAFENDSPPPDIRAAQDTILACNHLVLIYPLWLGTMPALTKAFLEQTFRYEFAFPPKPDGRFERKLKGRSARVIVTMGMPALAYRIWFGAHSLKSLERNILRFAGISPVRKTLLGRVEDCSEKQRASWLRRMEALGRRGR